MGKALDLLATGAVGIRYADGWRVRAFVRDGSQLSTISYGNGRWQCSECERADCSHVSSVKLVVKVL